MGIKIGLGRCLDYQKKIMYVDRGRDLLGKANIKFFVGKI
jgi:hypothetical protein